MRLLARTMTTTALVVVMIASAPKVYAMDKLDDIYFYFPTTTRNPSIPYEKVKFELNSTGLAQEIIKNPNGRTIKVITDNNANASYQLESNRFPVTPDKMIQIYYDITVEENGKMSLGLLNTLRNNWYGTELILGPGRYTGLYEQIVPEGETQTSVVFRNYHLGIAGQTTFIINDVDIQQEVVKQPETSLQEQKDQQSSSVAPIMNIAINQNDISISLLREGYISRNDKVFNKDSRILRLVSKQLKEYVDKITQRIGLIPYTKWYTELSDGDSKVYQHKKDINVRKNHIEVYAEASSAYLSYLMGCPNIIDLDIPLHTFIPAGIWPFQKLTRLESSNSVFNRAYSLFPNLRSLSLITPTILNSIPCVIAAPEEYLKKITKLDLEGKAQIPSSELQKFCNLQKLTLHASNIPSVEALQGLSHLTKLDVSFSGKKSLAVTENDLGSLTNLKSLTLSDAKSDGSFLSQLINLTSLKLDHTEITDEALSKCSQLTTLKVRDTKTVTNQSVSKLTKLMYLSLEGEDGITPACFPVLKNLEKIYYGTNWWNTLMISSNPGIPLTPAHIFQFQQDIDASKSKENEFPLFL